MMGATMVDELKDRLAAAMDAAGVGASRLAEHLDVSYQAVKKLLDGKSKSMDAVNCSKAARFLSVDTDWLATGDGGMARLSSTAQTAPPSSGIAPQAEFLPPPAAPTVTEAVTLLAGMTSGLSPVSRRVVGNLLSNLAADPGEAAEVAKTIEALVAAGRTHPTEATEPDDGAGASWHGQSGTQERFRVQGSMEDYRHATQEEIRQRSQKGDK